jgi:hypothetical protein
MVPADGITATLRTCAIAGGLLAMSCMVAVASSMAGTVVGWGYRGLGYVPPGTRFTAIAAGYGHSLALKTDGTVVGWGSSVPEGLTNVIAIAAGGGHSLALIRQPSPVIQVEVSGQQLQLSWPAEYSTAILESAPALDAGGPWAAVPGSGNPRAVALGTDRGFFRLRIP